MAKSNGYGTERQFHPGRQVGRGVFDPGFEPGAGPNAGIRRPPADIRPILGITSDNTLMEPRPNPRPTDGYGTRGGPNAYGITNNRTVRYGNDVPPPEAQAYEDEQEARDLYREGRWIG
jgi:hypothetical protein